MEPNDAVQFIVRYIRPVGLGYGHFTDGFNPLFHYFCSKRYRTVYGLYYITRSDIKIMSQSRLVQLANMRQYNAARGNCRVEIRLLPYFGQIYFLYTTIICEEVSSTYDGLIRNCMLIPNASVHGSALIDFYKHIFKNVGL